MPPNRKVYQTVKDTEKPWVVEEDGPFPCTRDDAWLGHGYYFWDYHIELGHWWGEKSYGTNGYMICEAYLDIDPERCWDLHNEGKHREEFIEALELLRNSKITNPKLITVAQVIEYAKSKGFFKHEAIRAHGIESASLDKKVKVGGYMLFDHGLKGYYEYYPAVQLCLLSQTSLDLSEYMVVWPDHHREDFVF